MAKYGFFIIAAVFVAVTFQEGTFTKTHFYFHNCFVYIKVSFVSLTNRLRKKKGKLLWKQYIHRKSNFYLYIVDLAMF